MKIVQINSFSNGSTGNIAQSIHQALIEEDNKSLFAYGAGPQINQGGYQIGNKICNFMHTLISLIVGVHGYSSYISTFKLIRKIKQFNPDLIHLHNMHGGYLHIRSLFRFIRKYRIKTVLTVHDCWIYTGKCYHYYEAKCNKYLYGCGGCPQLRMYPKSYFFDFTKKMLQDKKKWIEPISDLTIVTVSNWLNSQVRKTFLGQYPVQTIQNGVDDEYCISTQREDRIKRKNKFIILGVASSWNTHKGIHDFVELSRYLSDDEIIVLVGQIGDIKLPENIHVINRTESKRELSNLYNLASVYVSMSTEETFGLTIAEALCCGTPAIVYQATACAELIKNGENGYSVAPHNIPQVYAYIQKIKKGSFAKMEISRMARNQYSTKRMVDQYLTLYKEILHDID